MARFTTALTHAFRSRLNAVLGSLELVSQTQLNSSQHRFVETAVDEGRALLQLVNDALDMARIDAGELRLSDTLIDPVAIAEGAIGAVAARLHARGVAVASFIDPGTPVGTWGDGARLLQILVNLLDNARKATESGSVLLSVRPAPDDDCGEHLLFEVTDTGRGVAAAVREHLFDPFLPVHGQADWRMTSLGIGLALCRRLVEMMGGTIRYAARPDGGSVFSFDVRLRNDADCRRLADEVAEASGRSVMLVDADPVCRLSFVEQLRCWGLKVQAVADGQTAAALLAAEGCDLLLVHQDARDAAELLSERGLARSAAVLVPLGSAARLDLAEANPAALWLSSPMRRQAIIDASLGRAVAPIDLPEMPDSRVGGARARVLAIEDSASNQIVMTARLERMGCEVDAVATGAEAVRLVSQRHYGLVLADLSLPDMSGLEVAASIRQLEGAAGRVPIVAVTGGTHPRDRERCLAAGMNDFLVKPVEQIDLSRIVDRFAPREPVPEPAWSPERIERMGEDIGRERAVEILQTFERELGVRLGGMGTEHSLEKVGKEAHAIKSAALTFGASSLGEAAHSLELLCSQQQEETARQNAAALVVLGRTVQASVRDWLSQARKGTQ